MKYFSSVDSILGGCTVAFVCSKKHGALDCESELLSFFIDRLWSLNAQHNAIRSDLIINQMSGVVAYLYSTADRTRRRSEEHTSELQSLTNLVCRLLLE